MRKITKVRVFPGYRLELEFDDGVSGAVDLSHLVGKRVFAFYCFRKSNKLSAKSSPARRSSCSVHVRAMTPGQNRIGIFSSWSTVPSMKPARMPYSFGCTKSNGERRSPVRRRRAKPGGVEKCVEAAQSDPGWKAASVLGFSPVRYGVSSYWFI